MTHTLRPQNEPNRPYLRAFCISALCCAMMLLPFQLIDGGFFLYCGDFNSQQIPFYMYTQQFIKSGGGSVSWATDLGSGFMNTYSFYTLGSPFFWLAMIIPNRWLPYFMAPLLCVKFGVGGLGAYIYVRRYTKTTNAALIGSVLYTLSGWCVYDIFFNHFVDCCVLFPFFLAAFDAYFYDKQRAVLPLVLAVNLLNNYFFFLGESLFLVIYFICKVTSRDYRTSVREFFGLVGEVILGVLLGCLLILPAAASIFNNPRTNDYLWGYNMLVYGNSQQYFAILRSLFLPPDPPYLPSIFSDATVKWTSMSAYLPLVSTGAVIAWCRARRGAANKKVLIVCLVMALVPVLNSAFYALNSSYYARWYYMPVLIMALVTANALEDADIDLESGIRITAVICLGFAAFGLVPSKDSDGKLTFGVASDKAQFWLIIMLALLGLLIFYYAVTSSRGRRRFAAVMLAAVMAFGTLNGIIHIAIGKFPQHDGDANYKLQNYDVTADIVLPDGYFYRLDTYNCYDNLGLFLDKPCIQCFNSTVTPSILSFYPYVGVTRDVSSKPNSDLFALRGLLSVDYLLTPAASKADADSRYGSYGFTYVGETGDGVYALYKNSNFVPMGFTYDYYVLPDAISTITKNKRSNVLMKAVCLTEEQAAKYGQNLEVLPSAELLQTDYESYVADCAARRAESCSSFTATRSGFDATITLDRDNLVFFSVPYDEGYTAEVNGEKAEILEVDSGLMAIPAKAGDNTITVTYVPKWLRLSEALTAAGVMLFALYAAIVLRRRMKKGSPSGYLPSEVLARHPSVPALYGELSPADQFDEDVDDPPPADPAPQPAPVASGETMPGGAPTETAGSPAGPQGRNEMQDNDPAGPADPPQPEPGEEK